MLGRGYFYVLGTGAFLHVRPRGRAFLCVMPGGISMCYSHPGAFLHVMPGDIATCYAWGISMCYAHGHFYVLCLGAFLCVTPGGISMCYTWGHFYVLCPWAFSCFMPPGIFTFYAPRHFHVLCPWVFLIFLVPTQCLLQLLNLCRNQHLNPLLH